MKIKAQDAKDIKKIVPKALKNFKCKKDNQKNPNKIRKEKTSRNENKFNKEESRSNSQGKKIFRVKVRQHNLIIASKDRDNQLLTENKQISIFKIQNILEEKCKRKENNRNKLKVLQTKFKEKIKIFKVLLPD